MWRIVVADRQFAALPRRLHRPVLMKTLSSRIGQASLSVTGAGKLGINDAKNDPNAGDLLQRLQLRRPQMMLERGLRNQCDSMTEQELYRVKKCLINSPTNLIAGPPDFTYRIHEAFFELIPTDRWTSHGSRQGVGQ